MYNTYFNWVKIGLLLLDKTDRIKRKRLRFGCYSQLFPAICRYSQLFAITDRYWQVLEVNDSYRQLLAVIGSYCQLSALIHIELVITM